MYFHSKNENTYGIILVFKGNYISILRIEIYYLYIQVLLYTFRILLSRNEIPRKIDPDSIKYRPVTI